jgi:acetyl esterase/lipase
MRWYARFGIASLVIGVLAGPVIMASPAQAITVVLNVIYKQTPSVNIRLNVYEPDGTGPFPAAVVVHGGSFKNGSRWQYAATGKRLANSGVVAFVIDFRMPCHPQDIGPYTDPKLCHYPFPTPVEDIQSATQWVRAHGAQYKAIPGAVGLIGGSSGGNLVMEAAVTGIPGDSQADAIVSWSGQGDLTYRPDYAPGARVNYLDCNYTECPSKWAAASPALIVDPGDAPLYLSAGEVETPDPPFDQRETVQAWQDAGVPVQWHAVPGSDCHARGCFQNTVAPEIWDESVAWIYRWVG